MIGILDDKLFEGRSEVRPCIVNDGIIPLSIRLESPDVSASLDETEVYQLSPEPGTKP